MLVARARYDPCSVVVVASTNVADKQAKPIADPSIIPSDTGISERGKKTKKFSTRFPLLSSASIPLGFSSAFSPCTLQNVYRKGREKPRSSVFNIISFVVAAAAAVAATAYSWQSCERLGGCACPSSRRGTPSAGRLCSALRCNLNSPVLCSTRYRVASHGV